MKDKEYIEIKISGLKVLMDVEDVQILVDYTWYKHHNKNNNTIYMRGWNKNTRKKEMMHRVIIKAEKGKQVDHINGNTLDNRKSNLRICNHAENIRNRGQRKNSNTKHKGVFKSGKKWGANIGYENNRYYLGVFETQKEASLAYNKAALKYHGEFAQLNTVEGGKSDE